MSATRNRAAIGAADVRGHSHLLRKKTMALRVAFVVLVGSGIHSVPLHAQRASTASPPHVIGYLAGNAAERATPYVEALRDGLEEFGYRDGGNIRIEFRSASGDLDRLPALARELVALNVEILVVGAEQGLTAAKQATADRSIPIVAITCDPIDEFIVSLSRPGGSATGTTCSAADLAGKRLQLLKEVSSDLVRVAVLYNPGDPHKAQEFHDMTRDARSLGLSLTPIEVRKRADFDGAFSAIGAGRAQALVVLTDSFTFVHHQELARLAAANHLPAIYGFREFADAGGLMSYGAGLRGQFKRAAYYVDRILKGAKPADLPVEQPTKFELIINLRTAKTLGIEMPASLLAQADEVIE